MFQLTYKLEDHGWAMAAFGDGVARFEVAVSYMGDALLDFARAVRGILRGMGETSFRFVEEPGSHVFVLSRVAGGDDVRVEVYTSEGMYEGKLEERLLTATCGVRALTTTCINCLRHVLDEHGEAEYLRRWGSPFPITEYRELLELRRTL